MTGDGFVDTEGITEGAREGVDVFLVGIIDGTVVGSDDG